MSIIVRPAIEVENPFGAIASYISENVLPLVIAIETNKKQIQKLSDTELSDHTDILKQYAPDLLTPEGKIDWSKVEEYASSDDRTKQKLASYLLSARQLRTDFANASLYEKLQMLDAVGKATSPDQLRKIAVVGQGLKKVLDVIEKSNAPDELKLWFLLNHEAFYEKPELLEAVMKIFSKKEQASTKEEAKAPDTSWSLSYRPETLEEQVRKFLPDVELSLNLPAPPKIPTTKTKNSAPKSNKKEKPQKTATDTKEQKPVLPPPKEVGLQDAGFLDPIDLLLGGGALAGIGALGYGAFKYGPRIFSLIKEAPSQVIRLLKDLLLRKPSNKASQTADTVKTSTTQQSNKALLREERRQELKQKIAKEIEEFKKQAKQFEEEFKQFSRALPSKEIKALPPKSLSTILQKLKELEEQFKRFRRWYDIMKRGHKEKEREAELINKIRQELIKGADTKALPSKSQSTIEEIKQKELLDKLLKRIEARQQELSKEAEQLNKIRQELIKGTGTKALPSPQKATPEDIKRVQEGLKKLEEELKKTKKWEEVVRRVQEQQREAVERAEEMNRWIRSVFRGLPAFHPLKSALLKRKEELENVIKELKARLPSSEELKDIKNMVNEIKQLEQEIQKLKQLEEELTSLVKGGANKPEKVIKPTKKKKGK